MKHIAIILGFTAAALAQQPTTPVSHRVYYQSTRMLFVRQAGTQVGGAVKAAFLLGKGLHGAAVFEGATSPNPIKSRRPVFTVRPEESQMDDIRSPTIVRLKVKDGHRELAIVRGGVGKVSAGVSEHDIAPTTLTPTADNSYTLTPNEDLQPGEYLIFFNGAHKGGGYDFTVK